MRLPTGVRILFGAIAGIALLIGLFMLGAPAEFSGAQVGDGMECEGDVCRIFEVDESEWGITIQEFSDLPRTVLFEGSEAEAREWTRQQNRNWALRISAVWFGGAAVFGGLGYFAKPTRSS